MQTNPPVEYGKSHSAQAKKHLVALGVLRVFFFYSTGRTTQANVVVDEGSDTTLVRDGFVRRLGISGVDQILNLHGVSGTRGKFTSNRVQLTTQLPGGKETATRVAASGTNLSAARI